MTNEQWTTLKSGDHILPVSNGRPGTVLVELHMKDHVGRWIGVAYKGAVGLNSLVVNEVPECWALVQPAPGGQFKAVR